MGDNIKGSIVAKDKSKVKKAKNTSNSVVGQVRKEAAMISFVVGFLSSLLASWIFSLL